MRRIFTELSSHIGTSRFVLHTAYSFFLTYYSTENSLCQGGILISYRLFLLDLEHGAEDGGEGLGRADYHYFHKGVTFFPNVVCVFCGDLPCRTVCFQYLDAMHAAPKTMETAAEMPTTTQGGRKSEVSTPTPNAGRATYPHSHILQHFTVFSRSFPLPSVRGARY